MSNKTQPFVLTLRTVSGDTGELVPLGPVSTAETTRLVSPREWKLIKNSAELLFIEGTNSNDPIRFHGPCLQLAPWEKA